MNERPHPRSLLGTIASELRDLPGTAASLRSIGRLDYSWVAGDEPRGAAASQAAPERNVETVASAPAARTLSVPGVAVVPEQPR